MTSRQRAEQQTETYRALIEIAEEVAATPKTALDTTEDLRGKAITDAMKIDASATRARITAALASR